MDWIGGDGLGGHGLNAGEAGLVAVGGGGGGVDDAADPGDASGFEEVEGSVEVGLVAGAGLLDGAGDGGEGGEVEDGVDAFAGFREGFRVAEVGGVDLDFAGDGREVCAGAGVEVVEAADFVLAAVDEGLGEVGADEAGDAGDEEGGQRISDDGQTSNC